MLSSAKQEKARILVIDDEPLIGKLLSRMFVKNYQILTKGSGREAIASFEEGERFDLILCDMFMPRVSGIDLHKWLSSNLPGQADRMIFMTGGAYLTQAARFLEETRSLYIEKPFEMSDISALIQRELSRSRN